MYTDIEKIAHTLRCEHCGAAPDRPCVTTSGRRATRPHSVRTDPLYNAYWQGYEKGEHDTLSVIAGRSAAKAVSS